MMNKYLKKFISTVIVAIILISTASCEISDNDENCILTYKWTQTRVFKNDVEQFKLWLSNVDTTLIKNDIRWNYSAEFCDNNNSKDSQKMEGDIASLLEKIREQDEFSLLSEQGTIKEINGEYPIAVCAPSETDYSNTSFFLIRDAYSNAVRPAFAPDSTGFVCANYITADETLVSFKRYYDYDLAISCIPRTKESEYTVKYNGNALKLLCVNLPSSTGDKFFCTDGETLFSIYFFADDFSDVSSNVIENFFENLEITDIEIPKTTEESNRLVYRFPEYDLDARDWEDYASDYTEEIKNLLSSEEQYVWLDEFKDERQELYNMGEGMDYLVEQIRENGFYFLSYDNVYSSFKAEPAENTQYPANFPLTLISDAEGVDSLINTKPGENEKGTFRNAYSELEVLAHSAQRLPLDYGMNFVLKTYYGCDNAEEIFSGLEKEELNVTVAGEEVDWYFAGNFYYDGLSPRGISYLCEYNGVIFEFSVEDELSFVECGCEEGKPHDFWLSDLYDTKLDIVQMSFTE